MKVKEVKKHFVGIYKSLKNIATRLYVIEKANIMWSKRYDGLRTVDSLHNKRLLILEKDNIHLRGDLNKQMNLIGHTSELILMHGKVIKEINSRCKVRQRNPDTNYIDMINRPGRFWGEHEDKRLKENFNTFLKNAAKCHGRTKGAIKARVKKNLRVS